MKRKWLWVLVVLFPLLVLAGCGQDGQPGNSYLGVWVEFTDADEINYISCSALPTYFYYGYTEYGVPVTDTTYYGVDASSYYYEYQLDWWDGVSYHYSTIWYGTLTIEVEPGEKGAPFKDGADGLDRYYDWVLGWYGSDIGWVNPSAAPSVTPKKLSQSMFKQDLSRSVVPPTDTSTYNIGSTRVVTKSDGKYRITIVEHPVSLKGAALSLPKSAGH